MGSKGVLPVAVLGTTDFDVTTIDPTSITREGVSPLRWEMEDVATPYEINADECNVLDCHEETSDGFVDLTLKFELLGNLKSTHGYLLIKGGDVIFILKKEGSIMFHQQTLFCLSRDKKS